MIGCLVCKSQSSRDRTERCQLGSCQTVVLKLKALSEHIERKPLQECFSTSRLQDRVAQKMVNQISDLGVAEVVLPHVEDLEKVKKRLEGLNISTQTVQRVDLSPSVAT